MSILSENQSITPEWLQANGWEKDGWGSPSWRKKHNATIWCKVYNYEGRDGIARTVEAIWFPKDFEGYVVDYGYDMKGMAFFSTSDSTKRCPKMECNDICDIKTFISTILTQLKKDPYKYI